MSENYKIFATRSDYVENRSKKFRILEVSLKPVNKS